MKNTEKYRQKNDFKRFSHVFCIFLVLTLTLFSISFVSASGWWNDSWLKCKNIEIQASADKNNYPMINNQFKAINLTGLIFSSTNELRIIDAECKNDGNEIPYDVLSSGSNWAEVIFLANTTNGNITYSIYYKNEGVSAPSYSTDLSCAGNKIENDHFSSNLTFALAGAWGGILNDPKIKQGSNTNINPDGTNGMMNKAGTDTTGTCVSIFNGSIMSKIQCNSTAGKIKSDIFVYSKNPYIDTKIVSTDSSWSYRNTGMGFNGSYTATYHANDGTHPPIGAYEYVSSGEGWAVAYNTTLTNEMLGNIWNYSFPHANNISFYASSTNFWILIGEDPVNTFLMGQGTYYHRNILGTLDDVANETIFNNTEVELFQRTPFVYSLGDEENVHNFTENSQTYNSTTTMGARESFIINVTYNDTNFINSIGYLVYNGTSYIGTRIKSGGNYIFTRNINIPKVGTSTNITFYWKVLLTSQTENHYYNSTSNNQTINTLLADNCSNYNYVLYNFTIVDERTQTKLNGATQNTTAKLTLQIYTSDGITLIQNLSTSFNETNSFAICLNNNLSDGASYKIDLELEYDADDYAHEFYNIQDEVLTSSDISTNITLYDLDDANAQEFKITYKNENFLAVENALIQIQRKYIGEGLFKTIEIPKTDSNGETIAHLELSDVIYTIIVVKAGSTLATFNNIIAYCDNVATGDCEINLNAFASTIAVEDFATSDDFSYTFDWDDSTKTITVVYTIPSGTTSTVKLNTTLYDQLGDTEVCSDVLTSASGTLICVVPTSFGNSTVLAKLTKAGDFMGQAMIGINQEPSEIYGSNIVFLSLFLMITIVGLGISSNPMITGFFLLLGGILSVALNFVDTVGYFGAGATILWLFIAIIIILIKGSKRQ